MKLMDAKGDVRPGFAEEMASLVGFLLIMCDAEAARGPEGETDVTFTIVDVVELSMSTRVPAPVVCLSVCLPICLSVCLSVRLASSCSRHNMNTGVVLHPQPNYPNSPVTVVFEPL